MQLNEDAVNNDGSKNSATSVNLNGGGIETLDIGQNMPVELTRLQNQLNSRGYTSLLISAKQGNVDDLLQKLKNMLRLLPSRTAIMLTDANSVPDLETFKTKIGEILETKKTCKIILINNKLTVDHKDTDVTKEIEQSVEQKVQQSEGTQNIAK